MIAMKKVNVLKRLLWGLGIGIVWIPRPPFSGLLSKQILSELARRPRPQSSSINIH